MRSWWLYLFVFVVTGVYSQSPNKQIKLADSIADFDPGRAIQLLQKIQHTTTDPLIKRKSQLALNNAWFHKGDYNRSFLQLDSLSRVVEKQGDSADFYKLKFMIGRRHHFRGEHAQALENYFKILDYAYRNKDIHQFAEISNLIGGIYLNQSDGVNAYKYFQQGLRIQLRTHNDYKTGRGYLNLGNALNQQHRYVESRLMLDSSRQYYQKVHFDEGLSYVYATVAEIFTAKQAPDSALNYLLQSRAVLLKLNKLYALAQIDKDVAFQYYVKKDYTHALNYALEGLKVAEESGQVHNVSPLYQLLSEIEEEQGHSKQALQYYKLFKTSSDSVLNTASIKRQTEAAMQYAFNKQQYERDMKEEQQRLMAEAEGSQQRLVFFAVLAIVSLLAVFIYVRFRIKQRANAELSKAYHLLEDKNKQIQQKSTELSASLSEREMLLREIHHRVKNNLQVISGLLELQKEELTEAGSKAAFDEGQSRIKSISLIHQNLYQNDHLGSVKFNVFLTELVGQIQELFEVAHCEVDVQIEVPEIVLNIDTAVPLGLVLNELLTNSYKYAFNTATHGSITIRLLVEPGKQCVLYYTDTGPGLPEHIALSSGTTLGLRLIRGLANQLNGSAQYSFDGLAKFTITFPMV